jgi:hypothetical protein
MGTIIKNVLPDTELNRVRELCQASVRVQNRGPRVGKCQAQSLPLSLATHCTIYIDEKWEYGKDKNVYAITGWKGDKPIFRQLDNPSSNIKKYYFRRKA